VQRDRHSAFLAAIAVTGGSIERFAVEVRNLQHTEIGELQEPFRAGQAGSSAMPHKRNPVLTERLSGMARLLRGYALAGMEDQALWHERDISHSSTERIVFPDATLVLDYILTLFTGVMERLTVYPDHMQENLDRSFGLVFSQRVLLALIETGLSRQDAYKIVQRNAMIAWKDHRQFLDLLLADPEVTSRMSEPELRSLFDYNWYLTNIGATFERLGL
jgi:adenylosuccinate lyase